jgi:hypothetical protein
MASKQLLLQINYLQYPILVLYAWYDNILLSGNREIAHSSYSIPNQARVCYEHLSIKKC